MQCEAEQAIAKFQPVTIRMVFETPEEVMLFSKMLALDIDVPKHMVDNRSISRREEGVIQAIMGKAHKALRAFVE